MLALSFCVFCVHNNALMQSLLEYGKMCFEIAFMIKCLMHLVLNVNVKLC